jgi:glyoxylase-like metal-dependent hydrolase (beta-lactamase superfamily II)
MFQYTKETVLNNPEIVPVEGVTNPYTLKAGVTKYVIKGVGEYYSDCMSEVYKTEGYEGKPGSLEFKAVHTPGHTRGCVCYFCGDAVFTGDTVFAYDRGRTDLYGGDEAAIVESIQTLIPMLSGKTIYPGHGPARKF